MIKKREHIIYRVAAFLLVLSFLLPAGVSTVHAAQGHDHSDQCTFAGETHVHESKLDCDLGDLHTSKTDFFAFAKAYTLSLPEFFKELDGHLSSSLRIKAQTTSSRGPPVC